MRRPMQPIRACISTRLQGRTVSRSPPVIGLENPAEPLSAPHFAGLERSGAGGRQSAHRRGKREGHVRPLPVVVVDVLGQQVVQVPGAQDDEVVEALDLDALDQPLDMGVEVGRPVPQLRGLDADLGQRSAEGAVAGVPTGG